MLGLRLILPVVFLATTVAAQTVSQTARPRVLARRTTEAIAVDGRLDEPAWQQADVVTDFRQQDPREGAPATDRTEVRLLFDDRNFYVAVRATDSEPHRVNARELTRDADFANDDKFEILLDTYLDRRNAYRFAVNPLGTQQDALVTDEGRDVNLSWDAPWISAGRLDDHGWTVEIAIPLSNLRFREGRDTWGINFARITRRRNEEALWTSWQREFGLERVSQAGDLTGVGEIRRRRLLELKPYVTGGWRQGTPRVGEVGLDAGVFGRAGIEVAKLGITPSLTAELTANPDFGQVEVDEQVINLTRFSILLPEKRDFFLENAGIFLFGRAESNTLFFSRRIGLTEDGLAVPLDYGAKVTGRVGSFNLGLLQVGTRQMGEPAAPEFVPRRQFTAARFKADVLERSYVGAMLVNRQDSGLGFHRAFGFDTRFQLGDYWSIAGLVAGLDNPGPTSDAGTARVDIFYESDRWRFGGVYQQIGRNYAPEVGFVERGDIRDYFGTVDWMPRPRWLPIVRQFSFELEAEYYETKSLGTMETRKYQFEWNTEFQNSSSIMVTPVDRETDVLREPFAIRPGIVIPAGAYTFNRPSVAFTTDTSRRLVSEFGVEWGDFYGGKRELVLAELTFRPNAHLRLELADEFNRIRLPAGDFHTNLLTTRATVNFTRKWLTSTLVQFNSAADLATVNARVRYIFRPNSDLFLIYTQNTGKGLERPSRQFQVKLTYHMSR